MAKKNKPVAMAQVIAKPPKQASNLYLMLALAGITVICFWGALSCGFVNYDDELYIQKNQLLRSWTVADIPGWFFSGKAIYGGNYHPLVTLTNAIEYSLTGYNATLYHAVNLLIHVLNTLLVFTLIMKLSRQNQVISFAVALLFGIHPMHVESVVWVSERKDVLYTAFYLGAILQYLTYVDKKKMLHYGLSVLFFVLSLMSKSMAVTLPLVLIAVDYYYLKEGVKKASLLNKAPYFLLSLAFGYLALYSQRLQGYIAEYNYSFIDKVFLTCYSWIYYLLHLFAPVNLAVLHPFPVGGLPLTYYLSGLVVVLIMVSARYLVKNTEQRKAIVFGLLFYTLSISIVLQFVSVGAANVSERYTYVPYIGLFYIIAVLLEPWYKKKKTRVTVLFAIAVFMLCAITVNRLSAWQDGETLWRDATTKEPGASYAWFGLGNILKDKKGDPKEIMDAYNKAIAINPKAPKYLLNRAAARSDYGDKSGALLDLNAAVQLTPDFAEAYYNRGILAEDVKKHRDAIDDYTRAIFYDPEYLAAIYNRAIAYKENIQYDSAVADYHRVLALNPGYVNAWDNLGNIWFLTKNYPAAIEAYSKSLDIDPKQANIFMSRAMTYIQQGKKNEGCADIAKAIELGEPNATQAQQALCK